MRSRSLVVLAAIAVAVVAGVLAALLGNLEVAVAVVVLLVGGAAALIMRVYTRAGAAASAVQAAEREVGRLRRDLRLHHKDAASAAAVDRVRGQVMRANKSVAQQRDDVERQFSIVSTRLDGLDSELRALRKSVTSIRGLVNEARPGKLLTQVQALDQLRAKFNVSGPLPDVGGWALDPSALLWLVDEIERRRPDHVVECGSGTSTFWIALALQQNGHGRVVALDHLAEYAGRTQMILERHGLTDVAQVRHAPLVDTVTPRGIFPWYDVDPASIGPIDLLIVDGPPTSTGPLARYPALPVLHGELTPQSYVLVDDVHRKDERESIEHWLEEFPALRRTNYTNGSSEVLAYA